VIGQPARRGRQHRLIIACCTICLLLLSAATYVAARAEARPEHLDARDAPAAGLAEPPTTSPASTPPTTDAQQVEMGRRLYLTGCSSCHGVDGKGVTQPSGRVQGPSLIGVGEAAAYYMLDTGRMPLASPEQQPTSKPRAYPPDQQAALVAYVASLGPGPKPAKIDLAHADVAAGGELFRSNCAPCHNAAGVGGALSYGRHAPSLSNAPPLVVAAAVRYGPGQMPRFGAKTLTDAQVTDIAKYVQYLHHPHNRGGVALGGLGPVPEGFVTWVLGLGALMLLALWVSRRVRDYRQ
jgi:ubiquinol-cytochrome c reductase cytochrome c subunit